nr:hypothetical protein [Tanacetum cinerariifolium]
MRTRSRSRSRNKSPQREASPAIVEPLRIELLFLEDQFQEDPPPESPMADSRTMVQLLQAPTEVVARNQPNSSAGIQENLTASTDAATTFEVMEPESVVYVSLSSSDKTKKHDDKTKREAKGKKDITYSDDEEDVGAEADFSNLETSITISPILTTRVHKDHLVTQIIGDLSLAPQTSSMTRMVKDQGGLTQINDT